MPIVNKEIPNHSSLFTSERRKLRSLAYRMLGTLDSADDALQDTFVRFLQQELAQIQHPKAWLYKTCTNICLDVLKSSRHTRMNYVGVWLPEPISAEILIDFVDPAERRDRFSLAMMHAMQTLPPNERAAFLLAELLELNYREISAVLDKTENSCRQLVYRARQRLDGTLPTEAERRNLEELTDKFFISLLAGDVEGISQLVAEDVEFWSDGGGKVPSTINIIYSADRVTRLLQGLYKKFWHGLTFKQVEANGEPALLSVGPTGAETLICLQTGNKVQKIFVIRNPDKLKSFAQPAFAIQ
ncbi:sigma-70 family RNA polymerase sigma factor [Polycladidibacter hongkongensis]|uniref:sigma-70 family RNA polymerase sigma factor n=1 Tax=Polycladidibacter hongkongensis TaxID=1647556 RepID=UPI0008368E16|nr:sigma-70 family RNA polymerase sigma factor [Pseudovibrio hongkongensis]